MDDRRQERLREESEEHHGAVVAMLEGAGWAYAMDSLKARRRDVEICLARGLEREETAKREMQLEWRWLTRLINDPLKLFTHERKEPEP